MKNLLKITFLLIALSMGFVSCTDDDDQSDSIHSRTVIVYACTMNNLSSYWNNDLNEIIEGAKSLPDYNNIIIVNSNANSAPTIRLVNNTGITDVKSLPATMSLVNKEDMAIILKDIKARYPSDTYAIVFWGHGDAWMNHTSQQASSPRKAYGGENNRNFIEIPDLADALKQSGRFDYILFDCCLMMSAEVAYELRGVTDYIIGSPAEIPGNGAPYDHIVTELFADKKIAGRLIIDNYINYNKDTFNSDNCDNVPMSMVETRYMDTLAVVTKQAFDIVRQQYPNQDLPTDSLIYYWKYKSTDSRSEICYDLRHTMRKHLSEEDFKSWDSVFNLAVPYSRHPQDIRTTGKAPWMTVYNINFNSFLLNDNNYGGLSVFIPQSRYNSISSNIINPNQAINSTAWGQLIAW